MSQTAIDSKLLEEEGKTKSIVKQSFIAFFIGESVVITNNHILLMRTT